MVNNGHTVQVGYAPGSTLQVDGISFELKNNPLPRSGVKPHRNPIRWKDIWYTSIARGEIAVVAVMYEAGKANTAMTEAFRVTRRWRNPTSSVPLSLRNNCCPGRDYYRQRFSDHAALFGRGALVVMKTSRGRAKPKSMLSRL